MWRETGRMMTVIVDHHLPSGQWPWSEPPAIDPLAQAAARVCKRAGSPYGVPWDQGDPPPKYGSIFGFWLMADVTLSTLSWMINYWWLQMASSWRMVNDGGYHPTAGWTGRIADSASRELTPCDTISIHYLNPYWKPYDNIVVGYYPLREALISWWSATFNGLGKRPWRKAFWRGMKMQRPRHRSAALEPLASSWRAGRATELMNGAVKC